MKAGVVEKDIKFIDYIYLMIITQYIIRSRLHSAKILKQCKIALSPYDDKRFLFPSSTHTDKRMNVDSEQILNRECM